MFNKVVKKYLFVVFFCIFSTLSSLVVFAKTDLTFPEPKGYVNDYENIISNDEELENLIADFEATSTVEIAVVTTSDFQDTYIEDYSIRLFEAWGIGKADKDNGILIVVSSNQRESRIEVGYGLESIITDATAGRIQDYYMIPYFKNGDYSTGINEGVKAIIGIIQEDPEYSILALEETPAEENYDIWDFLDSFGFCFLVLIYILIAIMSSTRSWWLGGVIGVILGLIIGLIWFRWWGPFILPVVFGLAGLIIDWILSMLGPKGLGIISFRGGSGGGSGGRSSFGGFGGGSSGGGGSSRSWSRQ